MKNTPLLKMKGITKDDGLILDGIRDSLNDEKTWDDGIKPMGGVTERDVEGILVFLDVV